MTKDERDANNSTLYFKHGSSEEISLTRQKHQFIEFYHLPSDTSIAFKAAITDFSDNFVSSWKDEEAFGRMDPISLFQGTKRNISVSWTVHSYDLRDAMENMGRCSELYTMLYPDMDADRGVRGETIASNMKTAPLLKVKFMNLIQDVSNPGPSAKNGGLLGRVNGFNYKPALEFGVFDPLDLERELQSQENNFPLNWTASEKNLITHIFPKVINMNCELTVFHQHPMGWHKNEKRTGFSSFPYGIYSIKDEKAVIAKAEAIVRNIIGDEALQKAKAEAKRLELLAAERAQQEVTDLAKAKQANEFQNKLKAQKIRDDNIIRQHEESMALEKLKNKQDTQTESEHIKKRLASSQLTNNPIKNGQLFKGRR